MAGLFDKARDALNTEHGEKASDSVLGKVAEAADGVTGGKHTEQIGKARDTADEHIGRDGGRTTDPTASSDRR